MIELGAPNSIQIINVQDIWFWKHDAIEIFSVKSAYSVVKLTSGVDIVRPEVSGLILAKVYGNLGHHPN
jgi:hypothetical protein